MTKPMPPAAAPPPPGIDAAVLRGIRGAARDTGVDFGFLMAQAAQESGFRADARASTSSAAGLYQFIESTWLEMMRDHGARHGQAALSASIQTGPDGRPRVDDPALRRRILDLRDDPRLSAALGAEYARDNGERLERALGRPATPTDLYLAHFLGPGGAIEFLSAMRADATQPAAALLPRAAAANAAIFNDPETGRPRSLGAVHRHFERRIGEGSRAFAGLADDADPPPRRTFETRSPGPVSPPMRPGAGPWLTPPVSMVSLLALTALEPPSPKAKERA